MTNRIMVATVFLVGCAAGGVSSQLVVPKASAQQAATLTRWQNLCTQVADEEKLTDTGNRMGAEGWELVTMSQWANGTEYTLCFKRPKT